MITITKNGKTKTVSETVYKSVFKDSGWNVVGEQNSPTSAISQEKQKKAKKEIVEEKVVEEVVENNNENAVEDEIPDEVWDEAVAEEEVEKPISEMNHNELVAKAETLGIVTKGMNNKQLRDAIKEKM